MWTCHQALEFRLDSLSWIIDALLDVAADANARDLRACDQAHRSDDIKGTHHAPSPRCVRPWFESSLLNASFASDLEDTIARFQPPLWIHGHMHDATDETLGETRVIANTLGYPGVEGREFDPAFVLEI